MSFQAYLDKVKAKTGKTPDDFAKLAEAKGLNKHGDLVKWLKSDFVLGHGHATAIAGVVLSKGKPKPSRDEKLDSLFAGKKEHWREPSEKLIAELKKFGRDVEAKPGGTYINLLRGDRKFGILQPSSADRLDIGIKLKGQPANGRFEEAGKWNAMVTHRLRIHDQHEIDCEAVSWLKGAYDAAG